MPELRLHDLRHSYASFLVNAGRSLYEVQKLLGHHDPKVTMRYAHLSPQAMLEAVNVVGNVVTGASRNTLKAHFRNLVERGHLSQQGSGRGVWYELR